MDDFTAEALCWSHCADASVPAPLQVRSSRCRGNGSRQFSLEENVHDAQSRCSCPRSVRRDGGAHYPCLHGLPVCRSS